MKQPYRDASWLFVFHLIGRKMSGIKWIFLICRLNGYQHCVYWMANYAIAHAKQFKLMGFPKPKTKLQDKT
jgi:hypothetical protein